MSVSRDELLTRVLDVAARDGLADRSLREIAAAAGTSHRMLLYHFQSREGLLAAVVAAMEARQRATMTALAQTAAGPAALMTGIWRSVSDPAVRPFVRLFFEVLALTTRGDAPGPAGLTANWLDDAGKAGEQLGVTTDRAALRLGVAVTRGLLIDLLAGDDPAEVDAAHDLYVRLAGSLTPDGSPARP